MFNMNRHPWQRLTLLTTALLGSAALFAQDAADRENLFPDPSFASFTLRDNYRLVPDGGKDGGPALYCEQQRGEYKPLGLPIPTLTPGVIYKFGAWIRCEDVDRGKMRGASMLFEYSQNGNYMYGTGTYPKGVEGTADWTWVEGRTAAPAGMTNGLVYFALLQNQSGKAWFCQPRIWRDDSFEWHTAMIHPATRYALPPGRQTLAFFSEARGNDLPANLFAEVTITPQAGGGQAQIITAPVRGNRYEVAGDLTPGAFTVTAVLQRENGAELARRNPFTIAVPDPATQPADAVTIDALGRWRVGGKLFLPLILTTNHMANVFKDQGHHWKRSEIDRIGDSPFNTIHSYDAMFWTFTGEKSPEQVTTVLDAMHDAGLKVVFSVKDILPKGGRIWRSWHGHEGAAAVSEAVLAAYRRHPALLAWYTNDEVDVSAFHHEQRDRIGRLDPWHPTIQIQNFSGNFHERLDGADVFGNDPYPISKAESNIQEVFRSLGRSRELLVHQDSIAMASTVQVFSWHYYRKHDNAWFPNAEQLRAMALTMVVEGARAFFFFSYNDLFRNGFAERWPQACAVAQMLKDLEPFILADTPRRQLTPAPSSPHVRAAQFQDNAGRNAVVIAANGLEPVTVTFQLPAAATGYESVFGQTRDNGDGSWTFSATKANADIIRMK